MPGSWERLGSPSDAAASASGQSPLLSAKTTPSLHRRSASDGSVTPSAQLIPQRRLAAFAAWGLPVSPLWGSGALAGGGGRGIAVQHGVELQCFTGSAGEFFRTHPFDHLRMVMLQCSPAMMSAKRLACHFENAERRGSAGRGGVGRRCGGRWRPLRCVWAWHASCHSGVSSVDKRAAASAVG